MNDSGINHIEYNEKWNMLLSCADDGSVRLSYVPIPTKIPVMGMPDKLKEGNTNNHRFNFANNDPPIVWAKKLLPIFQGFQTGVALFSPRI